VGTRVAHSYGDDFFNKYFILNYYFMSGRNVFHMYVLYMVCLLGACVMHGIADFNNNTQALLFYG